MGLFRSTQVVVAIIVLCAMGFGLFFYKVTALDFPLAPDATTDFWDIETRVTFEGRGGAVRVKIPRVQDTAYLSVLPGESTLTPSGFGETFTRLRFGTDRFVAFERRQLSGRATIFYRAVVVDLDSGAPRRRATPVATSDYDAEARRIAAEEELTPFIFALDALIEAANERSANQDGFIAQLVESLANEDDDRVRALRAGGPDGVDEPARRLALVLNAADIPARRVVGLSLSPSAGTTAQVQRWVEVWQGGRWRAIDPVVGEELDPSRLMPLIMSERPLVESEGVENVTISYAVQRRPEDAATEALRRGDEAAPLISALSLLSLPLHTQNTFEVLLLIPVGAVVIAFLRQMIGLQAFGTFMPVLIALSFRETSLFTGIALFSGLVMIGLGLRAYFNGLQLLIVPRLAAVLSIVTLLMALIALVGNAFNIALGFSISLFPLVIITMTIERMSLVWDEFGAREALTRGAGSLAAAVVSYLVMSNDVVEHLAFMFPELLLIALAAMIALGRYNGYKLTEYFRFRSMAEPDVR